MQINYDFLDNYTFKNKAMTVRNRVVMAPTTLRSSLEDGSVSDNELHFYQLRAQGPGMIVTEVAYVNELGRGWEGGLSAAHDDNIPGLRRLASAIQSGGAKAILQIFFCWSPIDKCDFTWRNPCFGFSAALSKR